MFEIHRSERADALVDALADRLAQPLGDPFAAEIVAVPTRGVERWLTHRLGRSLGSSSLGDDGVCANVSFPYPGRLVGDALADATGIERTTDPWRTERLVWPLLDVLDAHAGEPWLRLIGRHIGVVPHDDGFDDLRRHRRFAAARHIATLFDRYATYRPSMLRAWIDGNDGDLPDDSRWQPELYRRLAEHVESTLGVACPPARLGDACDRIRQQPELVRLPDRLSLFGLTHVPASHREVLSALAAHRDVHLYALHPSLAWWGRVAAAGQDPAMARRDDRTTRIATHPLLRNWADDSREMQLVLSAAGEAAVTHHPVDDGTRSGLLQVLQADIRADRMPGAEATPPVLDPDDDSLRVHGCHGRLRQVEVLRDAICHLLAEHPELEPRDVIVMCPDIDEYAPLLHAVFGAHAPASDDDPHAPPANGVPRLPYRLADRALRQSNPLLEVLADVLELARSRLTAAEVLAFAGHPPVRQRFGLDDDDVDQITSWVLESGIRWGLDAEHREPWSLHRVRSNTWRTGLDRILLGVTMDESGSRLVGGCLPVDDVDSGAVELVGAFAELVDRLATVVAACRAPRPVAAWVDTLGEAVDLLARAPGADAWQRAQLDRVLRDTLGEASSDRGPSTAPLTVAEVAALLDHHLRGAPTRTDFRTGAITMCTLVPMRAVPHRVVCLLGLDADAFPRVGAGDGDDLLRDDPRIGDRDARTEDRQLLLDAVLAAEDHLVITYGSRDERTNEHRPPAVPLAELLDVLDDTARTAEGTGAGAAVLHHHPLQPFAPANFERTGRGPWGFDTTHLAGAEASRNPGAAPAFLDAPLAPVEEAEVDLDVLIRFLQHPAREFLRQRLDATTWEDDGTIPVTIPYELDALEEWRVGARLLDRLLSGDDLDAATAAERVRGLVPPDALGELTLERIGRVVGKLHTMADAVGATGPSTSQEIDVRCGGVRLLGTVAGVRGEQQATVTYSSTKPKDRLAAWVRLLALSATRPDVAWEALVLGKRNTRQGPRPTLHRLRPLDGPTDARQRLATEVLGGLVALRARGLRAPLPLPCATAEAWMTAERWRKTPEANARSEWVGSRFRPGERADAAHARVYGPDHPFEALLAIPADPADTGPGWDATQTSALGRLAHHVWAPLLAREEER